jgi:hypothetical protein
VNIALASRPPALAGGFLLRAAIFTAENAMCAEVSCRNEKKFATEITEATENAMSRLQNLWTGLLA